MAPDCWPATTAAPMVPAGSAERSVHPQACGEHIGLGSAASNTIGSSPRVWGTGGQSRSPAYSSAVHPHACGARQNDRRALASLGEGRIVEESLAVSVHGALRATDFKSAIVLAVDHSGDSDSTWAITGNVLGGAIGVEAIPDQWWGPLELREANEPISGDLWTVRSWRVDKMGSAAIGARSIRGC